MLRNRIRSNSGATILLALLFFLLCAMAGSIVLSAGSAASGRISGLAESEQAFYSVSSAAQVIREEIEGQEFQYTEEVSFGVAEKSYPFEPGGNLSKLLTDSTKEIFGGKATFTDTLTIHSADEQYQKILGDVTGEFTMDSNYNITIVLRLGNAANTDKSDKYLCRLTAKALIDTTYSEYEKEDANGVMQQISKTDTHVYWNECIIDKG